MEIKNKILTWVGVVSTALFALVGFTIQDKSILNLKTNSYNCNEIVLTETVNNLGK